MKQILTWTGLMVASTILTTGCMTAYFGSPPPENPLGIFEQANPAEKTAMAQKLEVPGTGLKITVNTFPALSQLDLIAAVYQDTVSGPAIELTFDDHGTIELDHITTKGRDGYLVICVADRPVAAWFITKRITDGKFLLHGDFTAEEAKQYIKSWNKQIKKNLAP